MVKSIQLFKSFPIKLLVAIHSFECDADCEEPCDYGHQPGEETTAEICPYGVNIVSGGYILKSHAVLGEDFECDDETTIRLQSTLKYLADQNGWPGDYDQRRSFEVKS